jgi:hypothetical protein
LEGGVPANEAALAQALQAAFPDVQVRPQWAALSGETAVYSPRVDVAVGPFALGTARYEDAYAQLAVDHRRLLSRLHAAFSNNALEIDSVASVPSLDEMSARNPNARCFLAIEVDCSGSRKHLMGGAINAAALGRLGLSVAGSPDLLRALLKMRRYLLFLASVGKNTFDPGNLMVVTMAQFMDALG